MQVFTTSALLFFLGLAAVSAQVTPTSIQDLSPQALADLEAELLAWKRSPAGEVAKKNGFVPAASSGMNIMGVDTLQNEQLQRLLNAKREIEHIQKTQPRATFSIDTPFALMTPEEFAAYAGRGLKPPRGVPPALAVNRTLHEETEKRALASLPATVEWQQSGCVTPVKDQFRCNTCTAFATTAAVESAVCVKSGAAKTLYEFSQQNQISCGVYHGDCNTGQYIQTALDWIPRLNGGSMCTSQSFPIVNSTAATTCSLYENEGVSCSKPDVGIAAYTGELWVASNTAKMMEKVALQPLAIELNPKLINYYKSGVIMGDEANCEGYPSIIHAVLLTGYGEENGVQYWRAKNSWSTTWGEKGYFRIERGYKGHPMGACGVETSYHHPVFASDAPTLATRRSSPWKRDVQLTGIAIDTIDVVDELDCSEKCRVKTECRSFSYDSTAYTCTLLSNVGTETSRSGHISGWIVKRTQTDLQCLAPEWHFDFPGNDIRTAQVPSYTDCCDLCNKVDACGAYTWTKFHGGSCYMKSKKSQSVWKGANSDGSAYFIAAEVYKCQPLIENTDLTGTDIGNAPASRAESCCAECRLLKGCTGFTWTNYNGGTCWLKSGAAFGMTANTGAMSGLI